MRDQLYDCGVEFKVRKIDCRNAILPREEGCDLLIRNKAELDQNRAQACARALLLSQRLLQLFSGDDLRLEQKIANPLRHSVLRAR